MSRPRQLKLEGTTIGMVAVLSYLGNNMYEARCERRKYNGAICNGLFVVRGDNLISGMVRSDGCMLETCGKKKYPSLSAAVKEVIVKHCIPGNRTYGFNALAEMFGVQSHQVRNFAHTIPHLVRKHLRYSVVDELPSYEDWLKEGTCQNASIIMRPSLRTW